jgi:callose synthase
MISRDVHRLANSFDFFRLLSFYYGGSGFYINTFMTVMFVYVYLYCRLILALPPVVELLVAREADRDPDAMKESISMALNNMAALQAVSQLGFLMSLPMLAYVGLEQGFRKAMYLFGQMLTTGSPLFFAFHLGTKAHYLDRTMMFGGAKCA